MMSEVSFEILCLDYARTAALLNHLRKYNGTIEEMKNVSSKLEEISSEMFEYLKNKKEESILTKFARCHPYGHYEVNLDPNASEKILESLKGRGYGYYSNNKYSIPERLGDRSVNCKDKPDEEYLKIFKDIETTMFCDVDSVQNAFLVMYNMYFSNALSLEEFEDYMKKKYVIVSDDVGTCKVKKRDGAL